MNSNPETFPNDSIPNPNNEPNSQPNSNPEQEIESPSPIPNSTPIPNNTGNNKSPLEKLAATIKPRSWGQLNTGLTSEFLRTRPGGGGNPLTQYANSAAWDPKTKQLLFIGNPHGEPQKFIIYKEDENFWREEKLFPCPLKDCNAHGYDHNTIDFNNSHFYYRSFKNKLIRKTFRYDIASEQWDELPEIPLNLPAPNPKTTAMEYFPELGGLVVVAKNVYLFDFSSNEWRILASDLEIGTTHILAEYNPIHKVVIFGGGNHPELNSNGTKFLYKLDASGNVSKLNDAPIELRVQSGSSNKVGTTISVDPVTGAYLIITSERDLYTYDVTKDYWQKQNPAPFDSRNTIVTPISNHGVVMFTKYDRNGNKAKVYIYKHADKEDTQPSPFNNPPPAPSPKETTDADAE